MTIDTILEKNLSTVSFRLGVFLVIYASMCFLCIFLPLVYSFIFSSLLLLLVHYLPDRPTTRRGEKRLS